MPYLAKQSSYNSVSTILVVKESNVSSSEFNSDLVVRLCFSVTITTQEEGLGFFRPLLHSFIIALLCSKSAQFSNICSLHVNL